jgi:hypothetical protein
MRSIIAATLALGLTVSVTMSHVLCAQRAPISVGMLAGANLSRVNLLDASVEAGEELLSQKSRLGGQAAFYATIPLTRRFALQPELHFTQKGGKASIALPIDEEELALFDGAEMTVGLRLSYFELPVLGRLELGSIGGWRPFVVAGPSFAVRVGCRATTEIGPVSFSGACDEDGALGDSEGGGDGVDNPDPVRTTDVTAIGGVGLQGSLLGRAFSAQVRYTQGLRSIATENIPGVSPKNRGVALVFGLGF